MPNTVDTASGAQATQREFAVGPPFSERYLVGFGLQLLMHIALVPVAAFVLIEVNAARWLATVAVGGTLVIAVEFVTIFILFVRPYLQRNQRLRISDHEVTLLDGDRVIRNIPYPELRIYRLTRYRGRLAQVRLGGSSGLIVLAAHHFRAGDLNTMIALIEARMAPDVLRRRDQMTLADMFPPLVLWVLALVCVVGVVLFALLS